MKTKRKGPVLKWRKTKTDWGHSYIAGPFEIQEYGEVNDATFDKELESYHGK